MSGVERLGSRKWFSMESGRPVSPDFRATLADSGATGR